MAQKSFAEREKYWTRIIEEARAYPSGIASYLRDNNLGSKNYYVWFKKLKPKHPEWQDPAPSKRGSAVAPAKETEVLESATRRRFTAAYKAGILNETDNASNGEIGAILRREGLYASHLSLWRQERAKRGLEAKKRGPKPNPEAQELKKLQKQYAKLQKKLQQANRIIDFQKKIAELLGETLPEYEEDEN